MADALTCPLCLQRLSPEDSVVVAPDGALSHVDCREPRALSLEERLSLVCYCSDHAVAECSRCRHTYRVNQLLSDYLRGGAHLCPGCHADMTESIRAHLYTCATLPEGVRKRAQAAREAARALVKQSWQLRDRADVLMRETEATIAALRDTWRQAASKDPDALLLLIRLKLADGRLPHAGIPPTIPGVPGDRSSCAACDEIVGPSDLMMVVVPRDPSRPFGVQDDRPVVMHTDCFQLWNHERRRWSEP